ncbi:MAG: VanW family protein [Candidatus Margulisbacteria bacterium]|nr:VanW family protein [Candidatus Margulisiibacteriota bacterium]
MRTLLKGLGIAAAASLLVALGLIGFDFLQTREKFPPQTFIGTVNVSGLDQPAALDKLRQLKVSQAFSAVVSLEAEKEFIPYAPEELGINFNREASIRQAFKLTHQRGYLSDLKTRLTEGAIRCPIVLSLNEHKLRDALETLANAIRSDPGNAAIILYEDTGGYHIEPESLGRVVNINETVKLFRQGLVEERTIFPVVIEYEEPRITEKELRAAPPVHRLAAFTTYYGKHDSPNRLHNIRLVASWVNNTLLMPGEVFSVADKLGEITPERGYKEAFVIMKGELVPQLGGGACQIATTLYNAIQLADIKVVQRRSHSMYFNIYPLGRDAGVFPPSLDFKFENDTGHPLLLKAIATNRRLSFRIYGTPTGKKVDFTYPRVYILTESGYVPSTVKAVLAADSPFKTEVTRTVLDRDGKELKSEKIVSFYKLYGEKENVPIARPEPR